MFSCEFFEILLQNTSGQLLLKLNYSMFLEGIALNNLIFILNNNYLLNVSRGYCPTWLYGHLNNRYLLVTTLMDRVEEGREGEVGSPCQKY